MARAETTSRTRPHTPLVIFILGAMTAIGPLSIDTYLPALPQLARDLSTGPSQAQLTLSACLFGLGLGQVITGPLSDSLGRKVPLVLGLAGYALASMLCALAPSVTALTILRAVQGATGAAGVVIANAIVRDLHSGAAAARFFSTLMLVTGLAPILAPILGAQILQLGSWRAVFVVLAVVGALLALAVSFGLQETLPLGRRKPLGIGRTLATFARLVRDPVFAGYALANGLCTAGMFAYISGYPFVIQGIYGLSPQAFSLMFGLNAVGLIALSQLNGRLVERYSPQRLLQAAMGVSLLAAAALAISVWLDLGLLGVVLPVLVFISSLGVINPNTAALALSGHPEAAGSASALLGLARFLLGSLTSPLVGVAGPDTAVPFALVITACVLLASIAVAMTSGQRALAREQHM